VSQELDKSIYQMRAAVLVRLAERNRLYVDVPSVETLVRTLKDDEIWSSIVRSNAGFVGFCRRMLNRFVHRSVKT